MVSKQKSIFDKEPVKVQPKKKKKLEDEFVPFEESIFARPKKVIGNNSDSDDKIKYKEPEFFIKDDGISFEESIFAKPIKIIKESNNNGNREYKSFIKDDGISLEESLFAIRRITPKKDTKDNKVEYKRTEFLVHTDYVPFEESIFAKHKSVVSSTPVVISEDDIINLVKLFNKYKDIYMKEYISNTERLNIIDANTFNNCCILLENSLKVKIMDIEAYAIVKKIIRNACTCVEDTFYCYTNINRALMDFITELSPVISVYDMYHIIDRSYAEVINEFCGQK